MTTVRGVMRAAASAARRDVEVLLGHVLDQSRAWLLAHADEPLSDRAMEQLSPLLKRLEHGEPLAYLIGKREFWGLELEVCNAVLIPRQETELLVELALDRIRRDARVLDLGTGSGAIAIAIAHERKDCRVTAADRSTAALTIAQHNAGRFGLDIEFVGGDWLSGLGRFDLILCNPPYVAANDPHLTALAHEPVDALVAGADGLDALRCVIADAPQHLYAQGHLVVEHGFDQGKAVRALFGRAGFAKIATFSDLAGYERATLGVAQ